MNAKCEFIWSVACSSAPGVTDVGGTIFAEDDDDDGTRLTAGSSTWLAMCSVQFN